MNYIVMFSDQPHNKVYVFDDGLREAEKLEECHDKYINKDMSPPLVMWLLQFLEEYSGYCVYNGASKIKPPKIDGGLPFQIIVTGWEIETGCA